MYSQQQRRKLRDELIAAAQADDRITAAALVGSAALDREDAWSDIDLALRLVTDLSPADVLDGWTARMYEHSAVDHLDMWSHSTLFRVFLLSSSLQVDLSFWPSDAFAASGASFRLLFGEANEPKPASSPAPRALVGTAWLFALHARSSIARGRSLQALYGERPPRSARPRLPSLSAARACAPTGPRRGRPAGRGDGNHRRDAGARIGSRRAEQSLRRGGDRLA